MFYKIHYNLVAVSMPLISKCYSHSTRTENLSSQHPIVIIIVNPFSKIENHQRLEHSTTGTVEAFKNFIHTIYRQ